MKIDTHAHFLDRKYLAEMQKVLGLTMSTTDDGKTLLRQGNATVAWSKEKFFDMDDRVRVMDRLGVDLRILSLSSPSIYEWPVHQQAPMARYMNDQLADICRAYPTRFRGLATLPLLDVAASLSELDRCVDELGFVGVAMGANLGGMALNDAHLGPIWSAINKRRIPVVEHPMLAQGAEFMDEFELPLRVGFIYDTTTAVARMIYGGIFERFPDFPFLVAHTGGAILMLLERLDNGYRLFPDCRKHINRLPSDYARALYYDTCAFFGPAIKMAKEIVGTEHLMYGADDPFIGAGPSYVEALDFTPEEMALILGGNAHRVFNL